MSHVKRIANNLSWLLLGNVIAGLIGLFTVVFVARKVGVAGFGEWQFALAFLAYFQLFSDSGFGLLGTKELSQKPEQKSQIVVNLILLRLIVAVLISLASAAVIFIFTAEGSFRWLLILTFIFVIPRALNCDWIFQGMGKMGFIAASKVLYSIVVLTAIFFLVNNPSNVVYVPLVQFFSGFLVSLIFIFILSRYLIKFDLKKINFKLWPGYLAVGVPLASSMALSLIYGNLDTIMLGVISTPVIVGLYSAAYKLVNIGVGLLGTWNATVFPVTNKKIMENISEAQIFINKMSKLTLLTVIPSVILTFLMSPQIVQGIYGNNYAESVLALQLVVWNLIPMAIGQIYAIHVLIPIGMNNEFLVCCLVGAAVNLIFNLILIPPFNFVGAAIATILAESSAATTAFWFSRKKIKLNMMKVLLPPVLYSLLSAGAFILVQGHVPYIIGAMVFALVYGLLLIAFEGNFLLGFITALISKKNGNK